MKRFLTTIIEKEGTGYVSLCPEIDIASQGKTVSEAKGKLQEALELFFECASPEEIETRLKDVQHLNYLSEADEHNRTDAYKELEAGNAIDLKKALAEW